MIGTVCVVVDVGNNIYRIHKITFFLNYFQHILDSCQFIKKKIFELLFIFAKNAV